ncbi:RidA family protein [Marinomonas posidonica]|uniref:RidA family protein n=1 Tax=Marinomonas posidonica TaxID=936476 RepID=UPI003735C8AC
MSNREAILPKSSERHALYEAHGYSAAMKSGDLLFVSGQVGSKLDGSPEPDFKKQVTLAFENLKNVLAAAGCSFEDIVDVTTFHTDPEQQIEAIMEVKQTQFNTTPPSNWTAVGVNWLAGFDFEIKVIARVPSAK